MPPKRYVQMPLPGMTIPPGVGPNPDPVSLSWSSRNLPKKKDEPKKAKPIISVDDTRS